MTKNASSDPARMERVVDYLAEHLDETLTLETIARVAHLSPYHFHRVYRGLLGETGRCIPGIQCERMRACRAALRAQRMRAELHSTQSCVA